MASKRFILDDWLLHDLAGENGREAQKEALEFLIRLKEQCDQIAFLIGTSWASKTYQLMTFGDRQRREISRYLHEVILRDPLKCQRLHPDRIEALPDHVREIIAQADKEDIYLFETYYAADADLLITTDEKLLKKIAEVDDLSITIRLRGEFLEEYLASGPE